MKRYEQGIDPPFPTAAKKMAAATNLSQRPKEGICIEMRKTRTFTPFRLHIRSPYSDHFRAFKALIIRKKEGKKTYRNLNFKNMEMYIGETCGKDSAEMAEFERVKELAKIQPGPYAYVKTWFLKKFPAYQEVAQIAPEEAYKPKMTLLTNN